jgi:small-conductance mechanosensitive channel/CRP-like cAMP-binding protein
MPHHETDLYWALGLLGGVIVTAAIVNITRPAHRPRLRRLLLLLVLYAVALAGGYGFEAGHLPQWSEGCFVVSDILRAFLIVNIAATIAFSVVLPVTGVVLPMIASDLLVGVVYVIAPLWIMSRYGLDPTSVLVSGTVVSAVLAISLQSTLGNILGGVALQLDGSIHEGDWVQLENGKQGRVRAVRWRHTTLETRDWDTIVVPNAQLLASSFTIMARRAGQAPVHRMWVWFNVDFRHSPTRVIDAVTEGILASPIENVADEPKPNCVCMDFSHDGRESYATYAVRYWLVDLAFDDPTNSRVRARIYTALARAGIPLAMPAQTAFVELHDEARAQRHREHELARHIEALGHVHLFQAFTPDELRTLAGGMSHVIYTKGETITHQGAVAHWLYVMTAGTADIRLHEADGSCTVVAQLKAPDFFGEMGLMTGEPRANDVVATTDVDCFRLGKDTFERVLLARPAIVDELSDKLAHRRVELFAKHDNLDASAKQARQASERERILGLIKSFFGL